MGCFQFRNMASSLRLTFVLFRTKRGLKGWGPEPFPFLQVKRGPLPVSPLWFNNLRFVDYRSWLSPSSAAAGKFWKQKEPKEVWPWRCSEENDDDDEKKEAGFSKNHIGMGWRWKDRKRKTGRRIRMDPACSAHTASFWLQPLLHVSNSIKKPSSRRRRNTHMGG